MLRLNIVLILPSIPSNTSVISSRVVIEGHLMITQCIIRLSALPLAEEGTTEFEEGFEMPPFSPSICNQVQTSSDLFQIS